MPPVRGVKIALGGKTRVLRFTTASLVALEDATGQTLGELSARTASGSVKSAVLLVWAGLLHAEPGLTVEQAVERVDMRRLSELSGALVQAINQALGLEDDDAPDKAAEEKATAAR